MFLTSFSQHPNDFFTHTPIPNELVRPCALHLLLRAPRPPPLHTARVARRPSLDDQSSDESLASACARRLRDRRLVRLPAVCSARRAESPPRLTARVATYNTFFCALFHSIREA